MERDISEAITIIAQLPEDEAEKALEILRQIRKPLSVP